MIHPLSRLQEYTTSLFHDKLIPDEPRNLYDPIDYTIMLGGKRLRPILLIAASQLFGGNIEEAVNAARAIEIYHNFTLLHDDLMDRSPLRRGKPTVYRRWGDNTAILSGDAMLVCAYQYMAAYSNDIINIFNRTALDVIEGQQYDMDFEQQSSVSIDDYMHMISLKTAALISGALRIGATIARANAHDVKAIADYGTALGLAFQLQDDILDTYGDETTFGKKPGQDIRDNKKTILLISAQQQASGATLEELNYLIGEPESDEKVSTVRAIYDRLGIRQQVETRINDLMQQAQAALQSIDADQAAKEPIIELTNKLVNRQK